MGMRIVLCLLFCICLIEANFSFFGNKGWWNWRRGGEGEGECWKGHNHGPHGEGEGESGHDHGDHCSHPGPFFCGSLFRYVSVNKNTFAIAKKRWRQSDVLTSFTLNTITERTASGAQAGTGAIGTVGSHAFDFSSPNAAPTNTYNRQTTFQGLNVCQTTVTFPLTSAGMDANVTVDVILFSSTGIITDGPFIREVTSGSVKFVITAVNWPWCTASANNCAGQVGSYLDFQLSTTFPHACQACPADKTLFSGGCGMYLTLPNDVILNNNQWSIQNSPYPTLSGSLVKCQLPFAVNSVSWSPMITVAQPFSFFRPTCPAKRVPSSSVGATSSAKFTFSSSAAPFNPSSSVTPFVPSSSAPFIPPPSSSAPFIPPPSSSAPFIPPPSSSAPFIPPPSSSAPFIPPPSSSAPFVPPPSSSAPFIPPPSSSAPFIPPPSSSAPFFPPPSSSAEVLMQSSSTGTSPIEGGSSSTFVSFSTAPGMDSSSSSGTGGGICDPQDDPNYNPWNSTCSHCGCFRPCPLSALPDLRFFTAALHFDEAECNGFPTDEAPAGTLCHVDCDVGFVTQGFWTCIDGSWIASNFSVPCSPQRYAAFNITAGNSTGSCGIITEDQSTTNVFIRTCAGNGLHNLEVQIAIFDDVVPTLPDEFVGNPEPPFTIDIKNQDEMPSNAYLNVSLCRPDFLPPPPPLRLYQSEDYGATWISSAVVCQNLGINIDTTPKYTPLDPNLNVACWSFPVCHTTLFIMGPVAPEADDNPGIVVKNHNSGYMWLWILCGVGACLIASFTCAAIRKCMGVKSKNNSNYTDITTSNYVMLDDTDEPPRHTKGRHSHSTSNLTATSETD